jgi:hypothetical protein
VSYRTVNYLAYRVSVAASAAIAYARETRALADESGRADVDMEARKADAAAERAKAALARCYECGQESPDGPVIRVADRRAYRWDEDEATRAVVRECFDAAQSAREDAGKAFKDAQAVSRLP